MAEVNIKLNETNLSLGLLWFVAFFFQFFFLFISTYLSLVVCYTYANVCVLLLICFLFVFICICYIYFILLILLFTFRSLLFFTRGLGECVLNPFTLHFVVTAGSRTIFATLSIAMSQKYSSDKYCCAVARNAFDAVPRLESIGMVTTE